MREDHPLGLEYASSGSCRDCVWAHHDLEEEGEVWFCSAASKSIDPSWGACVRVEHRLECLECSACCRSAFDVVEVSDDDPVLELQPAWIGQADGRNHVLRTASNHCACLMKDNRCIIYEDRPQCCRDFEKGSENCIFARRRVGLSPSWSI